MYSNVTPPTLPAYDSATNGFYLLVFNYEQGAEDWHMVHLIYGAWRFQYDEGLGITNTGTTFTRTYADGEWSEETQNTETLALNPGLRGSVYQRIYTNANIFNGDEIWLAAETVTPVEEEEPKKFPFKQWMGFYAAALCAKARAFPQPEREPVAFLYNGVRLPKLPEWDKTVYPYAAINLLYGDFYYFYAYSKQPYAESSSGQLTTNAEIGVIPLLWCDYLPSEGVWESYEGGGIKSTLAVGGHSPKVVWANFDVLNEDGKTLYLSASDPIPVYE